MAIAYICSKYIITIIYKAKLCMCNKPFVTNGDIASTKIDLSFRFYPVGIQNQVMKLDFTSLLS